MLKTSPAVFAVGHEYQIMFYTEGAAFVSVRVGESEFFDESNGIMRSLRNIHRIAVPMTLLDSARAYTVVEEKVIERLPYFSKTEPVVEHRYDFVPVPEKGARAFHIADAHGQTDGPVAACAAFGDVDFLIFNGDILNDSGNPDNFYNIYDMASRITGGTKPVIFSRGNHDLRGIHAESFADYTPNRAGYTYYTFRLGSVWGIVLDCGENKNDDRAEYGHSVRCHPFRLRETEYIKSVIADAEHEYLAPGVETRLVIVHNPFTRQLGDPFNIEVELYTEWARMLRENVKPHLMICGHVHTFDIDEVGGKHDQLGQPCTVVTSSYLASGISGGTGFVFGDDGIEVAFTLANGESRGREILGK